MKTRERLLIEAERQFASKGFHGASIGELAKCLSMAKASIMHHFESKARLYAAVLERAEASLLAAVDELPRGLPASDAFGQAALQVGRWASVHPDHARLYLREMLDRMNTERPGLDSFEAPIRKLEMVLEGSAVPGVSPRDRATGLLGLCCTDAASVDGAEAETVPAIPDVDARRERFYARAAAFADAAHALSS